MSHPFTNAEVLEALLETQADFTAALLDRLAVPLITVAQSPDCHAPMVVKVGHLSEADVIRILKAVTKCMERQAGAAAN